ncbi:MAG: hypothetical protein IJT45_09150 [Bacteroidales bacterium]|nr:hypothetical protein [Bacteroidales bacterium]
MMAFNEFRQLAENPPRKEEPSVFKVAVYGIDTIEMDQESENGDKESPSPTSTVAFCYLAVL